MIDTMAAERRTLFRQGALFLLLSAMLGLDRHLPIQVWCLGRWYSSSMVQSVGRRLPDPVIEVYKRDVDRTLLRENLRLTPEERVLKLQDFVALTFELRAAGKRARQAS